METGVTLAFSCNAEFEFLIMSQPGARAAFLHHGKTLHLNHGPIDLLVCCEGSTSAVSAAYREAQIAFVPLLSDLVSELPQLRTTLEADTSCFDGSVARRMHRACMPYRSYSVTAMASVAGAVADHILHKITRVSGLSRAWVNNGGDIALYLSQGQVFKCGVIGSIARESTVAKLTVCANDGISGIATSGQANFKQGGRSFSLGIADSVTVLAADSAAADVAATLLANHVDLPGHHSICRQPAHELDPDSDLTDRLVTTTVGELTLREVRSALRRGAELAQDFVNKKLIDQAFLTLRDQHCHVVAKAQLRGTTQSAKSVANWGVINSSATKRAAVSFNNCFSME